MQTARNIDTCWILCALLAAIGLSPTLLAQEPTPTAAAASPESATAEYPQAGDRPIAFSLEDTLQVPASAEISWDAFKGDVVLLEFWATWCGPCVGAIPHLNELAEHFAESDVHFVSVTMEERSVVENFLEHKEMASWIGMDTDKSMFDAFGVRGIPRTYLIDRDGKIAAITHPNNLKAEHIQNLLDRKDVGLASMTVDDPTPATVSAQRDVDPLFEIFIAESESEGMRSMTSSDAYEIDGATLPVILEYAYEIERSRIDVKLDIPLEEKYTARISLPTEMSSQLRPLLRQALETTFGIAAEWEHRERPVYVLSRAGGELGKGITKAFEGTGSHASWSDGSFSVGNYTIDGFLDMLEQVVDRPIVNETNLEGKYDISIFWDGDTEALVKALYEQLNMKLTPETRKVKTLVISKKEELSSTR